MYINYVERLHRMSDTELLAELHLKDTALSQVIERGHTNRWYVRNAGENYLKVLEEVARRQLNETTPSISS